MLVDDCIYGLLSQDILFVVCLNKDVPNIRILDLTLSNLNLGATLVLQAPDSLSILSNDEANCVIRHWNDVG